ncbi:UBX domain-containing protein 1 [Apis mellifera caucasica]|uniref:UBX domain-containing protein 1 n=1 Tax=Apis mellifera TaxID=7460 RepID=A0A7M7RBP7_APIME|nr:UBX domain-containing protein 1 [Apis mellifera]KAG6798805.1 UBX domain-containing protein 1 [Apis mellifera caucasica]KAG9432754.1 UBX domain-containing protein 1 [Apis mellifera carnica]|eukprot:XP_624715.1 UBX domain-containing protein 1 [Apis mellifera]
MSSSDINMLVDMGFSVSKAEKALEITGNKGVVPAMEWLLAHSNDAEPSSEPPITESSPASNLQTSVQEDITDASDQVSTTEVAKSMKCDICGKLFKSNLEVEFHATKSGHDRFSESTEEKKPLTDEEKKEQLRILTEKLKQKNKEREEQEKKDAQEREKNRIKSGKEMAQARRKLEELEMKKLLEERKREKEEEKLARQRVKEQIEADKAARRAKANAEKIVTESLSTPSSSTNIYRKEYNDTKLQIRLTNGQILTQNFGSKEKLSAVRLFVELNRTDTPGPFNLMTNFPKKIFTEDDYEAPLNALGLTPSAVLIVQKKVE